jgi:hypothetical protein
MGRMRVRWWCYPEDGIKTQMSTRCELDFGVQVEVEADVFGVGRDLWGRDVSRRAELFQAFDLSIKAAEGKHQQRSGD